eukprot:COSAG03_NODE_64_length_15177_cov_14.286112_18_plen_81_part_00
MCVGWGGVWGVCGNETLHLIHPCLVTFSFCHSFLSLSRVLCCRTPRSSPNPCTCHSGILPMYTCRHPIVLLPCYCLQHAL